jgi:type I restriction enzyme, S subunit
MPRVEYQSGYDAFRSSKSVTTGWLYLFLFSGASVRSVLNRTRGQVGQVNISLSQCRESEVPVPPLDEQHEIARRASAALAQVDRLVAAIELAETTLSRASRAALARAFRGDVVVGEVA